MKLKSLHVGLLGSLDGANSLSSSHHVLVLDAHNTTTPGSSDLLVVVVSSAEGLSKVLEIDNILSADIGDSDASGGLEVDKSAESGLASEEAEWDSLGSAKSWEMDDNLNWVDIMGNHDELGLAFFNESGDVVKTELEVSWLWSSVVSLLSSLLGLSLSLETVGLLLLGLWRVLGEELEELTGYWKSNSHY